VKLSTLHGLAIVASLVSCCGVAVGQLPPPPAEMERPSGGLGMLKFEQTDHNWGKIWDHEKVSHVFKFTNTGAEALTILDVRSTCGCTVPELTKKVYAPGESGEITVIFNPENREGHQVKSVTVTTDSRETPSIRLNIQSEVEKVLSVDPRMGNLGRIFKNEEKGMKVSILGSTADFEAWPAEEQAEAGPFRVELVESGEAEVDGETKRRSTVRVWVDAGLAVGRHAGDIVIRTNDSRRPEVVLRCAVTVVGDLQGRPPRFALGRLEPAQPFESTVRVLNRVAAEFKIVRIETTGELGEVEVSYTPAEEGKADAYDITVRGVAPEGNERVLGQIVLHTDMPDEPTFELPIYGFVNTLTTPTPQIGSGG